MPPQARARPAVQVRLALISSVRCSVSGRKRISEISSPTSAKLMIMFSAAISAVATPTWAGV